MTTQQVTVTVDSQGNLSFEPPPNFTCIAPSTLQITYTLAPDPVSQAHQFTQKGMNPTSSPPNSRSTAFTSQLTNNNKTLIVTNTNQLPAGAPSVNWRYNVCVTDGTQHYRREDPDILDEGPQ